MKAKLTSPVEGKLKELKEKLATTRDNPARLRLLEEIANLILRENPKEAIEYAKKALAIAENLDDLEAIMKIKNILARGYEIAGDLEKALDFNEQVLEIAQKHQDAQAQATSLNNIGLIYQKLNSLVLAAEYFYDSMAINEEIGNTRGVIINLMNIGTTFYYQQNFKKAKKYFENAFDMAQSADEGNLATRAKRKIALVYFAIEDYARALEIYLDCVRQEKGRENPDKLQIATDYNNIALMYENLDEYDKAVKNLEKALKIYSEFGDIKSISAIYINLGSVINKMGEPFRAIKTIAKGLNIAEQNQFKYILLNAHHLLYEIFEQIGDIPSAFEHYKKYVVLNDEISGPDKARQIAEIEANFRIKRQEKEIEILKTFSMTDPLTGIMNRRGILRVISDEMDAVSRGKTPFAIIICDIDFFKNINDTYGHNCGDSVLKAITSIIAEAKRKSDWLARWGGEEFLILLPGTTEEQAFVVAERIRKSIKEYVHKFERNDINITISLGIARFMPTGDTIQDCIERADKALYFAKQNGRNQSVCYSKIA